MKNAFNKAFVALPLVAALAACGGGNDDSPTTAAPLSEGGTGKVGAAADGRAIATAQASATAASDAAAAAVGAPFQTDASSRFFILGNDINEANLVEFGITQRADGAVVRMDNLSLIGDDAAVESIAGDASFAMGRWALGIFRLFSFDQPITAGSTGYHYIVFNGVAAFPGSGSYTCDTGTFTAPSRLSGSGQLTGVASGTASLSFAPAGAIVQSTIQVRANGFLGTQSFSTADTPLETPDHYLKTPGFVDSSGNGLLLTVGAAPGNAMRVVVPYQVPVRGIGYRGIATFVCTP
ncbi:hypothetical protein PV762_25985 [Mitsuaria sp. CC2]|uniref:hypothetical protein n=1 Tax=Mitsuaria sp. CC2 TaxID=3029186 RepID=UPI003B8C1FF8